MQKLLDAFKAKRDDKTLARVLAYDNKHPFASIMLNADDARLLRTLKFLSGE